MPANGHAVVIHELEAPYDSLVLEGMDRPFQGVDAATAQIASVTRLPGSPEAVVHAMGVAEEPIVLEGRFHDNVLRIFGQSPEDQVSTVRGLVYRLHPCWMTWGTLITKLGRVSSFTPTYIRDNDIQYRITFDVDRAAEPRKVLRTRAADEVGDVRRRIERLQNPLSDVGDAMNRAFRVP